MKNMIIYSNSINQTEFLRSLSLNGKDNFGIRVLNTNEICDEANIKLGYKVKDKFISYTQQVLLVYEINKQNNFYNFTSFDDIKHVTDTLNALRMIITEEDEIKEFSSKVTDVLTQDKNTELLKKIFQEYLAVLDELKLVDKTSFVKKIISYNTKVFDEVVVFEEKLQPLEWALLDAIANKVIVTDLADFMGIEKATSPVVSSITPYFGERNEIEGVLYDIFQNKYQLDECSIVLANKSKYTFLLDEYANKYNIPMSFETGLPITLSNPYKLYRTLCKLENECFFDVKGYKRLFMCEAFTDSYFDTLDYRLRMDAIEVLGRLKIGFNAEENDRKIKDFESIDKDNFLTFMEKINRSMDIDRIVNLVKKIAHEFGKGKENVIRLCTKMRDGEYAQVDKDGLTVITTILHDSEMHEFSKTMKDSFLKEIDIQYLKSTINKEGKLHITDLRKGLSTLRKHVHFVGFSANNFPGKAVEDYLLPNDAITLLTNDTNRASEQKIKDKIDMFDRLLIAYSSLGLDIHLSYSCQNIKEVKDVNPSSAVLKLVKDQDAFEKAKKEAGYFQTDVSKLSKLVKAFLSNKKLTTKEVENKQEIQHDDLTRMSFSPSAISSFFGCPLKFYLDSVLYAGKNIEYDYFNALGGPVFGNLLHLVMEMIYKKNIQQDDVLPFIKKVFTDYQKFDVSLNDPDVNYEEFEESCLNAYNYLKTFDEIVGTEVKVRGEIFGLYFKGEIDAIGKKDGKYYIIDWKTKKPIEHADNDVEKDIQGIIYAYLYEKCFNIKVDGVYFFYTRYYREIPFENPFNANIQEQIKEKIVIFKNALENKEFPRVLEGDAKYDKDTPCTFCDWKHLC